MKKKTLLFLSIFGLFLNAYSTSGYISKEGSITESQTWSGTIYISKTVKIKQQIKVTVLPGTVIKMGNNANILTSEPVDGYTNAELILQGTSDAPITITSEDDNSVGATIDGSNGTPEPGDWGTITLRANTVNIKHVNIYYGAEITESALKTASTTENCTISNSIISKSGGHGVYIGKNATIRNCNFENNGGRGITTFVSLVDSINVYNCAFNYNGSDGIHISVYAGAVTVNGCTFNNNEEKGIVISGSNSSIGRELPSDCYINNNTFVNNGQEAVKLTGVSINSPYIGNTVHGNGLNAFVIAYLRETCDSLSLYKNNGIPYVIGEYVNIGITLNIYEGTVIKLTNSDINVLENGKLNIRGTKEEPVIFTSLSDDSIAGDTNNDSLKTSPAVNRAIYADGELNIAYAKFYYSPIQINDRANIHHSSFDNVNSRNDYTAIHGAVDMDNCSFANNFYGLSPSSKTSYVNNCIFKNNDAGIRNRGRIDVRNSHFESNRLGVYIEYGYYTNLGNNATDSIGGNIFTNNTEYDIYNLSAYKVSAIMNKFDGTTAYEIDAKIYDDNERESSGEVLFSPWIRETSTITFIASVDGTLGEGVEITIADSTITTGADGRACIDLANDDYYYTYSYNGVTSDSIAITIADDRSLKVVVASAIIPLVKKSNIQLYPNPNTGSFSVLFDEIGGIKQIKIYTIQGTLVSQTTCAGHKQSIDINDKGLFIIETSSNSGICREQVLVR